MNRIRVILAEDHMIVRKGIRSLLEAEPDFEVLAEASDGREAVDLVRQFLPDVILMDIGMPGLNGLEATRQIKQWYPQTNVLVLTMYDTEEHIFQILQAGASGYLVKQTAPVELAQAIRSVAQGETYLSPTVSKMVIDQYIRQAERVTKPNRFDNLTSREREVLQLVAEGKSSPQIADLLHISEKTVRNHRNNLMDKLDLHSIAELTRYAIQKGVIDLD